MPRFYDLFLDNALIFLLARERRMKSWSSVTGASQSLLWLSRKLVSTIVVGKTLRALHECFEAKSEIMGKLKLENGHFNGGLPKLLCSEQIRVLLVSSYGAHVLANASLC